MLFINFSSFTNMPNVQQSEAQPAPQQPIPTKKSSNRSLYFIGCFVIFMLMIASAVGGAYLGSKYFPSTTEDDTSDDTNGDDTGDENGDDTNGDDDGTYTEGSIKVTSPTSGQEVNGKIYVEGEASEILDELTVRIYDDDWNKIGEQTAALESGDSNPMRSWSIFLDVMQSPTTLTGHVRVFPTERGESSNLTQTVNVRFQGLLAAGRIKLYAPLKFQVMEGEAVSFRGQMKDFVEGNLGVRLLNEDDVEIFKETITAQTDNIGNFAQFEKTLQHRLSLENYGVRGSWELYEIDVEGQAGDVILSVQVRFPAI